MLSSKKITVLLKAAEDKPTQVKPERKQEFTRRALLNPDITPQHKLGLLKLNQDNKIGILSQLQAHTLHHLFQKKERFFSNDYHYDWWVFPMHVPAQWRWPERNYHASINLEEAKTLLVDDQYVQTYLACLQNYLTAIEKHGWNDYPIRFARMLHSVALFIEGAVANKQQSIQKALCEIAQQAITYAASYDFETKYKHNDIMISGLEKVHTQLNFTNYQTQVDDLFPKGGATP